MMEKFYIASKNVNLEIVARLLNSMADKYGCYVRYDLKENSLKFIGNEECWKNIVEEIMEFIFPQISKVIEKSNA